MLFIHIKDHCGSIKRSFRADQIKEVHTETEHDYGEDREYYTRVTLHYMDGDSDSYGQTVDLEDLMNQISNLGV